MTRNSNQPSPNHALQRTAPRVTVAAILAWTRLVRSWRCPTSAASLCAPPSQLPRHAPPSLSLGSLITSAGSATDKPTRSATLGGYSHDSPTATHLQLPPVPSGCVVRVYHIGPKAFRDAPRNQTDWAAYLRAQGVTFPRGGFAAYFATSATLIVANTTEQLQLLDPF